MTIKLQPQDPWAQALEKDLAVALELADGPVLTQPQVNAVLVLALNRLNDELERRGPPTVADTAREFIKKITSEGDLSDPHVFRRLTRALSVLPTIEQAFAESAADEENAMLKHTPKFRRGGSSVLSGYSSGSPMLYEPDGSLGPDLTDSFGGPERNQDPSAVETFQSKLVREGMALAGKLTDSLENQGSGQMLRAKVDALQLELSARKAGHPDLAEAARSLREGTAIPGVTPVPVPLVPGVSATPGDFVMLRGSMVIYEVLSVALLADDGPQYTLKNPEIPGQSTALHSDVAAVYSKGSYHWSHVHGNDTVGHGG